jgi:hypothetical protein
MPGKLDALALGVRVQIELLKQIGLFDVGKGLRER